MSIFFFYYYRKVECLILYFVMYSLMYNVIYLFFCINIMMLMLNILVFDIFFKWD